ncbi:SDR family NAD(P)-dependent oxidoreductase [Nonomuraea antimicrobica]|uniref:SDR family NAD(P)-dependent oxidoreductase n=1 Tax=Nonomuraea antimicrobica TaxID=561173 RepID=A0ABP7CF60_9ACTN
MSAVAGTRGTALVIGAGPGLGMSIARRFGREGHRIALVSRTDTRHARYLGELAEAGIEATAYAADVRDRDRLLAVLDTVAERNGSIDVVYYGPAAPDSGPRPGPIESIDAESVREAMELLYPAVDVAHRVLPGMTARGAGGLLFAGGVSAVMPMPSLGALAVLSAALRNYAVTLHAALAGTGVYAGTLTIGGLIERGDIHALVTSQPGRYGDVAHATLNPDDLAEGAWELYTKREHPERTFSNL